MEEREFYTTDWSKVGGWKEPFGDRGLRELEAARIEHAYYSHLGRRLVARAKSIDALPPQKREQARAIVQMRRDGMTIAKIARELGMSERTVKRRLHDLGLTKKT